MVCTDSDPGLYRLVWQSLLPLCVEMGSGHGSVACRGVRAQTLLETLIHRWWGRCGQSEPLLGIRPQTGGSTMDTPVNAQHLWTVQSPEERHWPLPAPPTPKRHGWYPHRTPLLTVGIPGAVSMMAHSSQLFPLGDSPLAQHAWASPCLSAPCPQAAPPGPASVRLLPRDPSERPAHRSLQPDTLSTALLQSPILSPPPA